MTVAYLRPSVVEVDLGAIVANVETLRRMTGVDCCVVVKADAYGHGAVGVAAAALDAGASRLAVAAVEEAIELRDAGIAAPILVLAEPPDEASALAAVRAEVALTVGSAAGLARLERIARAVAKVAAVDLKVDTGMHRAGLRPEEASEVAAAAGDSPNLRVDGFWTHLAVADRPGRPETATQLRRFDEVLRALDRSGVRPRWRHAANSAAAIAHPEARYDMVRCGIAVYGIAPSEPLASLVELQPALSLRSVVARVEVVGAGEGVSYGLAGAAPVARQIVTVPIGYADGVDRHLGHGKGAVLIGGRRRPIVGAVTMDHLMVDCGDGDVAVGDEVVLLGSQGAERVTADDWAIWLDTIPYEVVSRLGHRLPRVYRPSR